MKVADANVFGIRVGVSINLFVKKKEDSSETPQLFYYRTDDLWNKKQKFDFLNERQHAGGIEWQPIQPDARHTWLTKGLHAEFDTFIPMGTKKQSTKRAGGRCSISKHIATVSLRGVIAWAYNFNRNMLLIT